MTFLKSQCGGSFFWESRPYGGGKCIIKFAKQRTFHDINDKFLMKF